MPQLQWSSERQTLCCGRKIFDPARLEWDEMRDSFSDTSLIDVEPGEALRRYAVQGRLRRVPIAIIGPREASADECDLAQKLGYAYARHGLQLICGGKNGVMEAACKGHVEGGGLPIGILPDEEWQMANPYVAIPLAMGIGPARNALIARAAVVLVAVGGGVGTLSEMALGLQFGRLVLAMLKAPLIDGVERIATIETAIERIGARIFQF